MESVKEQTWQDFEHIVVDGNSTDGSLELIKSYSYPALSYLSEPDSGIYNAMNKGIARAQGKYLLFLNSGDYLENNDVLNNIKSCFESNTSIISGNIIFNKEGETRLRKHPEHMTFSYLVGNAISHPSTFIKSELFQTYGSYNEEYKIVSDWAFFLKVLGLNNESYSNLDQTISVFDASGISSKAENHKRIYEERNEVLKTYFPRVYNNENDTYIFNNFKTTSKRFKYLQRIEGQPFIRKLTTVFLGFMDSIIRIFKASK